MNVQNRKYARRPNRGLGFLSGLLMGGLAGAGAMLLLAPQSGEKTRAQLQQKSIELQDQSTKGVEAAKDAIAQVRVKAKRVTADVLEKAEDLQERGKQLIEDQKERLTTFVEAG